MYGFYVYAIKYMYVCTDVPRRSNPFETSLCTCIRMYTYMYTYTYMNIYEYMYAYICIYMLK